MMTATYLRSVLSYSPRTGIFVWKKDKGKMKRGDVAGCNCRGYFLIRINNQQYRAHQLAWFYMTGRWPKNEIDHIKSKKNRFSNLREATHRENMCNSKLRKDNTSGVKGVHWAKRDKRWFARINVMGKTKFLGYFENLKDAARAYAVASTKYHGAFGRLK